MSFLLTAGGALLVLFLLAYLRAGRFGSTVLSFGVGYLLALMWADKGVYEDVVLSALSPTDTVYLVLIIVPGILAMFFSSKQKSLLPRIVQAFAIAVLGVAMLLPVSGETGAVYALTTASRTPLALGNAPQMATVAAVESRPTAADYSGTLAWVLTVLAGIGLAVLVVMEVRQRSDSMAGKGGLPTAV